MPQARALREQQHPINISSSYHINDYTIFCWFIKFELATSAHISCKDRATIQHPERRGQKIRRKRPQFGILVHL